VPDGNAHLWSITVEPKLRLNPHNKIDPYVVGGVGYYRRTVEFTRLVLPSVVIFDPFFGGFFNTVVQTNQVLGDITHGGIGGSLVVDSTSNSARLVLRSSLKRDKIMPIRDEWPRGWSR
jgi:hypothetical protein